MEILDTTGGYLLSQQLCSKDVELKQCGKEHLLVTAVIEKGLYQVTQLIQVTRGRKELSSKASKGIKG